MNSRSCPRARRSLATRLAGLAAGGLALAFAGGCQTPGAAGRAGEGDDVWAIRVFSASGAGHDRKAEAYATALRGVKGLRADRVQTHHSASASDIYYGQYTHKYDTKTGRVHYDPDPANDLNLIHGLRFGQGGPPPFLAATMTPLPSGSAGVANPEWDLSKQQGYWSLHVAVFYNTEGMTRRKQAAEEYCKLLREQGAEAYFHHGPVKSSVTIGVFPKRAVDTVKVTDPATKAARVESLILDDRLAKLQQKYDVSLENGHRMVEVIRDQNGKIVERRPTPSFIVQLPSEADAGLVP